MIIVLEIIISFVLYIGTNLWMDVTTSFFRILISIFNKVLTFRTVSLVFDSRTIISSKNKRGS